MKVLVVDDSSAVRLLLLAKLTAWGHDVALANDGTDAWDQLQVTRFELVICDWDMPGLNGPELCQQIRKHDSLRYLYVILCTGKDGKEDLIAGIEAGADDFITKPIDFRELLVRVKSALRVTNLQSELAGHNDSLVQLNSKLTSAYQIIERDLQAAAATQSSLLPKIYDVHPRVRLDWTFLPSHFLAGDMLNYFLADGRYLVFYHLDVSGHGIPAALLSVTLNKILLPVTGSPCIRPQAAEGQFEIVPPAEVVAELNNRFQSEDDTYFTMMYGVFDTATRQLRYCQAGHPGPIVVSRDSVPRLIGNGGFPVGLLPGMQYEEQTIQLNEHDKLLLYSDGVTECESLTGEPYGDGRLLDLLMETREQGLQSVMQTVRDSISSWRGQAEYSDDVSILALECN